MGKEVKKLPDNTKPGKEGSAKHYVTTLRDSLKKIPQALPWNWPGKSTPGGIDRDKLRKNVKEYLEKIFWEDMKDMNLSGLAVKDIVLTPTVFSESKNNKDLLYFSVAGEYEIFTFNKRNFSGSLSSTIAVEKTNGIKDTFNFVPGDKNKITLYEHGYRYEKQIDIDIIDDLNKRYKGDFEDKFKKSPSVPLFGDTICINVTLAVNNEAKNLRYTFKRNFRLMKSFDRIKMIEMPWSLESADETTDPCPIPDDAQIIEDTKGDLYAFFSADDIPAMKRGFFKNIDSSHHTSGIKSKTFKEKVPIVVTQSELILAIKFQYRLGSFSAYSNFNVEATIKYQYDSVNKKWKYAGIDVNKHTRA